MKTVRARARSLVLSTLMAAVSEMTAEAPSSRSQGPTSSGCLTTATTRSRRILHSWMTTCPVALLAALRMTQSPGCTSRRHKVKAT